MCESVLLLGCETWTLYRRHFKALVAYHAKSLQKILGLHWWQKVPHTEMRSRANTHSMEHLVMQRQLRWIGHVIRMQSNPIGSHVALYTLTAEWPASPRRPEEALLRSRERNLEEVFNTS